MATEAQETLKVGAKILEGVMHFHEFVFAPISIGVGSGGAYAAGEFRRGDRFLELHFRRSLGLVTYHVGSLSLSHEDYMWSVVGQRYRTHYPGFSSDPLDGFRRLVIDLKEHCGGFLVGSDSIFAEHVERAGRLKEVAKRLP